MQQAALALARLGGDGIERQVCDALTNDHGFSGIEQRVSQFEIDLFHRAHHTVRTVGSQPPDPRTSRITVAKSRSACSPSPMKDEPCMSANCFGCRAVKSRRIRSVIGV